ncbi:helix-turn-helix domain-containing protein [Streptomyces sp. NPDC017529]|uniref:helix-turn-helix domain-containing protein n=1 Tax=Streptomyces sp. NPDC017529 TaxID=3365000 RepID=UPI0037A99328
MPEPTGPPGQLAPVLSKLQRAFRPSLRSLGDVTRLSPSYLSRIMSGERFPSWDATARLARACGRPSGPSQNLGRRPDPPRHAARRPHPPLGPALPAPARWLPHPAIGDWIK